MRVFRRLVMLAILGATAIAAWNWMKAHPEYNPVAPLDLRDLDGMATTHKLAALRGDIPNCRAVLERSQVAFTVLPPEGEGACARPDRTVLNELQLAPSAPPVTCPVAAALTRWHDQVVAMAAREILGTEIARIEHLGAYSCRRTYGSEEGAWSEHATANAIDIAAFVMADGRRISVLDNWSGEGPEAQFLRTVRDGACRNFATVLSPEYNAAHADHFHLDQSERWWGLCR